MPGKHHNQSSKICGLWVWLSSKPRKIHRWNCWVSLAFQSCRPVFLLSSKLQEGVLPLWTTGQKTREHQHLALQNKNSFVVNQMPTSVDQNKDKPVINLLKITSWHSLTEFWVLQIISYKIIKSTQIKFNFHGLQAWNFPLLLSINFTETLMFGIHQETVAALCIGCNSMDLRGFSFFSYFSSTMDLRALDWKSHPTRGISWNLHKLTPVF